MIQQTRKFPKKNQTVTKLNFKFINNWPVHTHTHTHAHSTIKIKALPEHPYTLTLVPGLWTAERFLSCWYSRPCFI